MYKPASFRRCRYLSSIFAILYLILSGLGPFACRLFALGFSPHALRIPEEEVYDVIESFFWCIPDILKVSGSRIRYTLLRVNHPGVALMIKNHYR